jgi:tetratricopeptide (TPR) repeat protein
MNNHPTRAALEGFLWSRLSPRENQAVLAHLIAGCPRCRSEMEPLATAMLLPGAQEPELDSALDAAYDAAITTAASSALERVQQIQREREEVQRAPLAAPADERVWTWGACEALLEQSHSLRLDDPQGMLRCANLAVLAIEQLDPAVYGETALADLQARAWAGLANAYRILEDVPQADAAMRRALEHRGQGTGDPLLLARISDVAASLASYKQEFSAAFRMLDISYALYQEFGDYHEAGRVLVLKGLYLGHMNEPEKGIGLVTRGLEMIDGERDPHLAFQALYNLLCLWVELGESAAVAAHFERARPLCEHYPGRIERIKLDAMLGRIAYELGDLDRAAAGLARAASQFDELGMGYWASLATLDLANVRLQQGRPREVRALLGHLVRNFGVLGADSEIMTGLNLLQKTLEIEQLGRAVEIAGKLSKSIRETLMFHRIGTE